MTCLWPWGQSPAAPVAGPAVAWFPAVGQSHLSTAPLCPARTCCCRTPVKDPPSPLTRYTATQTLARAPSAYFHYCDLAFFPPFFALAAYVLLPLAAPLPFPLLLLILAAAAAVGSWLFATRLAGVTAARVQASRSFLSFIATCEVAYPLVYGTHVAPRWQGGRGLGSVLLLVGMCALPLLHAAAAWSDPGYVVVEADEEGSKAAGGEQGEAGGGQGGKEGEADVEGGSGAEGRGQQQGGSAGGTGKEVATAEGAGPRPPQLPLPLAECSTCQMPRPLRSKHCQFCNKCVRRFGESRGVLVGDKRSAVTGLARPCVLCLPPVLIVPITLAPCRTLFTLYSSNSAKEYLITPFPSPLTDHHCPAIANCVGEANERVFAAWLFVMVGRGTAGVGVGVLEGAWGKGVKGPVVRSNGDDGLRGSPA